VALFSATMPPQIRRIAQTYLRDPVEVTIAAKTTTSANIRQRYWWVSGMHKLDALTRILEVEPFDAMIIFARTKAATEAGQQAAGARLAAAAINGDMQQAQRERPSPAQGRQAGHPGGHRRGRARPGRGAHQPRAELRHPVRHRKLRAPHRPHRPRRPQRRGDPVRHPREKGMLRQIERATRQPIEEMRCRAWKRSTTSG
jgi:ATP-dependent RNA helicase DeaD